MWSISRTIRMLPAVTTKSFVESLHLLFRKHLAQICTRRVENLQSLLPRQTKVPEHVLGRTVENVTNLLSLVGALVLD